VESWGGQHDTEGGEKWSSSKVMERSELYRVIAESNRYVRAVRTKISNTRRALLGPFEHTPHGVK